MIMCHKRSYRGGRQDNLMVAVKSNHDSPHRADRLIISKTSILSGWTLSIMLHTALLQRPSTSMVIRGN